MDIDIVVEEEFFVKVREIDDVEHTHYFFVHVTLLCLRIVGMRDY
jgi:hypothetical protein